MIEIGFSQVIKGCSKKDVCIAVFSENKSLNPD